MNMGGIEVTNFLNYGLYSHTSPEIADLIKDKILDKTVLEVGCAEGDFMIAMKNAGAKKVIGIEKQKGMYNIAVKRGLEVIQGDTFEMGWPKADVYYFYFCDFWCLDRVIEKIDKEKLKGVFIFGDPQSYFFDHYTRLRGAEVRVGCNGTFRVYTITIEIK